MQFVIDKVHEILEFCEEFAFDKFSKTVGHIDIVISKRLKSTWGTAIMLPNGYCLIKINGNIFNEHTVESDTFRSLIIHEYAHLLDRVIYNNSGHGKTWKYIMQCFSVNPSVYVTNEEREETGYNYVTRKTIRYVHHCNCQQHAVGGRMHKKILMGCKYRCRKCGSLLNADYTIIK